MEAKKTQALALKEEGNSLAREGKKRDALAKYEKGLRCLGFDTDPLELDDSDDDREADPVAQVLEALDGDGRELLSVLASNAAQMCMDPGAPQLAKAIERSSLAVRANPGNAKAFFRRATAAFDHAANVAKGADGLLARALADVGLFLEKEPGSAAGLALRDKLRRRRQEIQPPILREKVKPQPEVPPEWFEKAKKRAIFVCIAGGDNRNMSPEYLAESLLSMASHAKDKGAISVGVAYVGTNKNADEIEAFTNEWQKKYYRMLRLSEQHVQVPPARRVEVRGEPCSLWSLLEGRVRVLRVPAALADGELVGAAWLRHCAQLLWHGEPYVYQSCSSYLRFQPRWDELLRDDLDMANRRSQHKVLLSWMSLSHSDEEKWQWVASKSNGWGDGAMPTGTLVVESFESGFGWPCFRKREFSHRFGTPPQVAFLTMHNLFASSDFLLEVPADPLMNGLPFHGQLACENARAFASGWDVFSPTQNATWTSRRVEGWAHLYRVLGGSAAPQVCMEGGGIAAETLEARRARADACLAVWADEGRQANPVEDEALDLPLPTALFWTATRPRDASPWQTGREAGPRFQRAPRRVMTAFERQTGIDLTRHVVSDKAKNGGLTSDKDFEDNEVEMIRRRKEVAAMMFDQ